MRQLPPALVAAVVLCAAVVVRLSIGGPIGPVACVGGSDMPAPFEPGTRAHRSAPMGCLPANTAAQAPPAAPDVAAAGDAPDPAHAYKGPYRIDGVWLVSSTPPDASPDSPGSPSASTTVPRVATAPASATTTAH